MARGDIFECEECGHNWKTRGHGTKVCPNCGSNNILKEENKSAQAVRLGRVEAERQMAKAEERKTELKIIKEEDKRKRREEILGILGGKEYHRRMSLIESSNTNNHEKDQLKKSLGMDKKDFENSIKIAEERSKKSRIKNISIGIILIIGVFIFLVIPFSIGIFSENLEKPYISSNCTYKESIESNEFINVLYDTEGNRYVDPTEIQNIATSSVGSPSFDIINKIPLSISIKVTYDLSHSGGNNWENIEETLEIGPLEKESISNNGASGILWGTTSIGNIRINYFSNEDLEFKAEKKMIEICKKCGENDCLDDGVVCESNNECGSGICNLAGVCGKERIVECPKGKINKNDQCVDSPITKFKNNYFKISPFIFILLVIIIIYFSKRISRNNK